MGAEGEAIAAPRFVHRRLLQWVVGGITVLNLAIGVAYVALFVSLFRSGLARGADFTAFDTGWRIVLAGRGEGLYDPNVQAGFQRALLGGASFTAGLNPFDNPPHLVLPFAPLGLLPLSIGYLVWTAVQLVLVGVLFSQFMRFADWTKVERWMIGGWLIAFPATAIAFYQGAFSLLVAVAITAAYAALRDGRDTSAGLFLVLATLKPQVASGPALAALVARRGRAIMTALTVGGVLCLFATAVFGVGVWPSYVSFLETYVSSFDRLSVDPSVMWNMRGTLTLLLGRGEAGTINLLSFCVYALGLFVVAFLWRAGWRRENEGDARIRLVLTLLITLLVSPHLNPHDDVLLVVAAVLTYSAIRGRPESTAFALVASATPIAVLVTNGLAADAPTSLPVRVPTLVILALAIAAASWLHRGIAPEFRRFALQPKSAVKPLPVPRPGRDS